MKSSIGFVSNSYMTSFFIKIKNNTDKEMNGMNLWNLRSPEFNKEKDASLCCSNDCYIDDAFDVNFIIKPGEEVIFRLSYTDDVGWVLGSEEFQKVQNSDLEYFCCDC